ncbi:MAG: SPOR domain-containing protein [Pseudomonadota bacterium]
MPSAENRSFWNRHFGRRRLAAAPAPRTALLLTTVAFVGGCASLDNPDSYDLGRAGDTPFYETNTVAVSAQSNAHTGVAGWDGDVSATGKTAAHATLLPGSWARVTNTRTGGSSVVRVTRRLPAAQDRQIELSRDAALDVGALHEGYANVLIEPIDPRQASAEERIAVQSPSQFARPQAFAAAQSPAPVETIAYDGPLDPEYTRSVSTQRVQSARPAPAYSADIATATTNRYAAPAAAPLPQRRADFATASTPRAATPRASAPLRSAPRSAAAASSRYLQLGSFRNPTYAQRARAKLEQQGLAGGAYGAAFVQPVYVNGAVFHRVRLGPLDTPALARRALEDARRAGHTGARLVRP